MVSFLSKSFFKAILSLWGVATLLFLLFNFLGDPARMLLDQREDLDQLQNIKHKYGLDLSKSKRYLHFLNDLSPISKHSLNKNDFSFLERSHPQLQVRKQTEHQWVLKVPNLRTSYQKNNKKVIDVLKETLPNTLLLAVISIVFTTIIGIALGSFLAVKTNPVLDKITLLLSSLGMSLPSFFSAIIFSWLFAFVLHNYTGLNMTGNLIEIDDFGEGNILKLQNLILPCLVLGIRPLAVVIQMTKSSLLDTYQQEYITTAKAKGLSPFQIFWKHALKNSLNPVLTTISGWFAGMLAGAVFVEYIFNWNGLGKELVYALNTSDLPVITGGILCIATFFITINIVMDIIYAWLDPSIELN